MITYMHSVLVNNILFILLNQNNMEISARNKMKGTIDEITLGSVMAKVKINIGNGNIISSVITIESVADLKLKVGDEVYAIVKSTEVMIGK
jgi:molybdate transport system regulatory protein